MSFFVDPKANKLFDEAMQASGFNTADTRVVRDMARHATDEAFRRMMVVAQTAPENMQGVIMLAAVAMIRTECDRQLDSLLKQLSEQLQ